MLDRFVGGQLDVRQLLGSETELEPDQELNEEVNVDNGYAQVEDAVGAPRKLHEHNMSFGHWDNMKAFLQDIRGDLAGLMEQKASVEELFQGDGRLGGARHAPGAGSQ